MDFAVIMSIITHTVAYNSGGFAPNQKSHGAKSGKYGGYGAIWVEFMAK